MGACPLYLMGGRVDKGDWKIILGKVDEKGGYAGTILIPFIQVTEEGNEDRRTN